MLSAAHIQQLHFAVQLQWDTVRRNKNTVSLKKVRNGWFCTCLHEFITVKCNASYAQASFPGQKSLRFPRSTRA